MLIKTAGTLLDDNPQLSGINLAHNAASAREPGAAFSEDAVCEE